MRRSEGRDVGEEKDVIPLGSMLLANAKREEGDQERHEEEE